MTLRRKVVASGLAVVTLALTWLVGVQSTAGQVLGEILSARHMASRGAL